MGQAIIEVSAKLLASSLIMPKGTEIIEVSSVRRQLLTSDYNIILLLVESPDLPDVPPEVITPKITADESEWKPAEGLTWSWEG